MANIVTSTSNYVEWTQSRYANYHEMQWRINHCCHSYYCCCHCCYHRVKIKWNEWNQQFLLFDFAIEMVFLFVIVVAIVVAFVAICNTFVFSHCTHCLSLLLLLLLLPTTHATNQQEKRKNDTQISSSRQRRQQRREQLSKWHICCGSDCDCLCLCLCHCRRQLEGSLRLLLHLHLSLQVTVAIVVVVAVAGVTCCVYQELWWITGYRVTLQFQFLVDFFGFAFLFLFDLFIFCCSFFAHFSLARWARTFLKHCVCHDECDRRRTEGVGEGRVAPGADVNVDDGKAPLGSSDCTRAAETNETMWMRDQSQS